MQESFKKFRVCLSNNLRAKLCVSLYCQIQEMIRENEKAPEMERLELQEFNLDVEEQKRLNVIMEQEVTRVIHAHKNECNGSFLLLFF